MSKNIFLNCSFLMVSTESKDCLKCLNVWQSPVLKRCPASWPGVSKATLIYPAWVLVMSHALGNYLRLGRNTVSGAAFKHRGTVAVNCGQQRDKTAQTFKKYSNVFDSIFLITWHIAFYDFFKKCICSDSFLLLFATVRGENYKPQKFCNIFKVLECPTA